MLQYFAALPAPAGVVIGPITNTANGHLYYLLSPTNWIGARLEAGRVGGTLVTINDAAENAWVFDTFANYDGVARNLWLGLKDSGQEGNWVWDSGDSASYRNWAPGEPDNGGSGGNEDYAVMRGPALSAPGMWNDVAGDATNDPVVEKIPPLPVGLAPAISTQPHSWTAAVGANVTFLVSVVGTEPFGYQWRRNGTDLVGATSAALTLSNLQMADAGTYSVRVSNAFGGAMSSNATLTVFTPGTNCVAQPAGLVSWWRAEGNANDSAGTNHGTGVSSYVAGKVGQAFAFGGFQLFEGRINFGSTNSISIEGWIYARQSPNGSICKLGPIQLSMEPSPGNVSFQIGLPWTPSTSLQAPVGTNQWQHVAATLDGTSGTMILYVDGVARAQTNNVVTQLGWVEPIWIGALRVFFGFIVSEFNGLIDELSVYSRALSANEVQAIYNADGAGKCVVSPAVLAVASLVCEPGPSPTLRIGGTAGTTYLIQASTNLHNWQVVGSSVADTNGVCEFEDSNSVSFPYRYYRVCTQ
jgi:hypothetical protein